MERGIRRLAIFQDEMDFEVFLEILKKEAMEKECKIHAYCLMTNHFHLLVETGNVEIGKFMKNLAGKYAMYYNHKYSYKGHIFEGRYKSILVETDSYFLQSSRYIHLNPVKDKRIVELNDIVEEVKESEEWEAVKMNILEIGIEKGIEQGLQQGLQQGVQQGAEKKLLEQVEKKLKKGQTIAQIADALEESEAKIWEVVDLLQKD